MAARLPVRSTGPRAAGSIPASLALRDLLEAEQPSREPPPSPRRRACRRARWTAAIVAGALFLAAAGYLVADQVQARAQFDRAQRALGVTRHRTGTVSTQLGQLTRDFHVLETQVGSDSTALDQAGSQLQGAQTALAAAQAHVSQQASLIASLRTCLGGVTKALNALAVGNQGRALSQLTSVSSSCTAATAASG